MLLWVAGRSHRLAPEVLEMVVDAANELYFSAASVWEIGIKAALRRKDFAADPRHLVRALADNGYLELPVTARHALRAAALPPVHRDPFDRMLVAQALAEPMTLLTNDALLGRYGSTVKVV